MNERASTPAALAWLGHPVSLAAVALLVVNDHLLKAAFPGLLTGKLSDVAGLVFAPALLATVAGLGLPRLPQRTTAIGALVVSGLGFGWVKATVAGAQTASAAWSLLRPSTVLADPTDLVALPALGLAWWVWRRTRVAPVPDELVRLVRSCALVPLALLAIAASSTPVAPAIRADVRVLVWHGQVVVGESTGRADYTTDLPQHFVGSADGAHWAALAGPDDPALRALLGKEFVTETCVPALPAHCFRVVPGTLGVDESTDAGRHWHRAWEVSDGRREFLARQAAQAGMDPDPVEANFRSTEVAVITVPDGYLVVVANLRDGVAVRQPDGGWRRIGLPGADGGSPAQALAAPGSGIVGEYLLAGLVGATLLGLAVQAVLGRRQKEAGVAAGLVLLGLTAASVSARSSGSPIAFTVGFGILALPAALWWVALVARDPRLRRQYTWSVLKVAGPTAVGVAAAFVGWSLGYPDGYSTAAILAAGVVVVGTALTAVPTLRQRGLTRRLDRSAKQASGLSGPVGEDDLSTGAPD